LTPHGIELMLKRRGAADLMLLLGCAWEDLPRHFAARAAADRAQELQTKLGIGQDRQTFRRRRTLSNTMPHPPPSHKLAHYLARCSSP
jgi:hypothetical protein